MAEEIKPAVMDVSNRITVPMEVREKLGLKPGDHVGFRIEGTRIIIGKARWQMDG